MCVFVLTLFYWFVFNLCVFSLDVVRGVVCGIDFGIINFCVVVMEGKIFKVLENVEGLRIIFFVVVFIFEGERLVGIFVKR